MTNCEFLIKVMFIFVVSIVKGRKKKKKERSESALQLEFLFFPRAGFKGKKSSVHLGDINQLRLNFSILRIFSFSSI